MTKESIAAALNGREYTNEISYAERAQAKVEGFVILIGGSDDLACFHGAIEDEIDCVGGGDIFVLPNKVMTGEHHCDCGYCGFLAVKEKARKIEAVWGSEDGYSWTYNTDITHSVFDIMEDGEKYCRGIVFHLSDLEVGA